jgi:hypothetical protein
VHFWINFSLIPQTVDMASFEGGPYMKHGHLRRLIVQRLLSTKGAHLRSLGGIQCVILGSLHNHHVHLGVMLAWYSWAHP